MNNAVVKIQQATKTFKPLFPWLRTLLRGKKPQAVIALEDVTLSLFSGEVFGLVGRNGQGKTTLVKLIAGLIEPTSGTVEIYGYRHSKHSREIKQQIGLVTSDERSFYWRLTGKQNLQFFSRLFGLAGKQSRERIEELTKLFDLSEILNRRFNEYSTGNKQRLAIARALLTDPPLLLLDEPTRSLDPIAAEELRKLVVEWANRSQQKTILITTHNLSEIEQICTRIGILSRHRLKECATLTELQSKYNCKEEITLRVKADCAMEEWSLLQNQFPYGQWRTPAPTIWELQWARQKEDGTLDSALRNLIRSGVEILDCRIEQKVLQDIFSEIEREK